jgi:gas vesicle protein
MGKDASAIRQEIEQTRERMGDTVEALAYKTDVPARVKDNVNERVESVRGAIGDVVDTIKTAVAGASDTVKTGVAGASETVGDALNSGTRNGAGVAARTRDKVSAAVDKVSGDVTQRLHDADIAGTTQRAVGVAQENPLGLALAALAIGFLTGSLLPVSDPERRRLRPIGEKIADQAQAATADLVEAGKAVVAETAMTAAATAVTSAQSHGSDVVDAAKTRLDQSRNGG